MLEKLKAWAQRTRARIAAAVAAIIAAVLAFFGANEAPAQAVVDVLTWENPTARTDGSPLAPGELTGVRIQWGDTAAGPFDDGQVFVDAPGTRVEVSRELEPFGTRCYVAVAVDSFGRDSAPTAAACKAIIAPPNAPENFGLAEQ